MSADLTPEDRAREAGGRMKRNLALGGVAGIAAALAITAPASAQTTYIGCQGTKWPKPRVAPRNCDTWYPWLAHYQAHNFERLRWRHWGASQATARGVDVYRGMGNVVRTPVRLTAWRPRGFDTYGGGVDLPAYTRLTVQYRGGNTDTVRLAWGYDLWPLY